MGSTYGENFRFTIFGQSHSPAIGVTMEGLPAGLAVDFEELQVFLSRRAPGVSPVTTSRREPDVPQFISGLVGNVTCGAPLTAIIPNTNIRSQDYDNLQDCPRPGHADFTAQMKYGGMQDVAGGGHFSGRLTAPLCIAGGICKQILAQMGITIGAHILSIGNIQDDPFDPIQIDAQSLQLLLCKPKPVLAEGRWEKMETAILEVKAQGDSLGGIIECAAVGLPPGWGDPMFDGMENRIAQAVFGIPAVRGIEFGSGFASTRALGSQHNDPYYMDGAVIKTKTNHHGGILGGITSGMPLIFRTAIKPTASIHKVQGSVSFSKGTDEELVIHGRHDPCIVPRAVPCVEAAAAVAIFDAYCTSKKGG